jgi:hypothetical protein
MNWPRIVTAETLDNLDPNDPAAQHARRDLRRVHAAMRTRSILRGALASMPALRHRARPLRMLELGAGDGHLMLGVARASSRDWPPVQLRLLDRHAVVDADTLAGFSALGWTATQAVTDVFDWARERTDPDSHWDVIVANLFLHHFEAAPLTTLLAAIATRTDHFVAIEPRRSRLSWVGSHWVGALGANAVTRDDAVISVNAGFTGNELSQCWPQSTVPWTLREAPAGLFSHRFVATREPVV